MYSEDIKTGNCLNTDFKNINKILNAATYRSRVHAQQMNEETNKKSTQRYTVEANDQYGDV